MQGMNMRFLSRTALIIMTLSLWGCSTDLEVNAPYRAFTVIYAAFDKNETTHLVKINKSFLGDGNALDMAQVQDSSEFTNDQLQAVVHKIENGSVTATYPLNDTTITDRIPGTFYYPEQTLYTFSAVLDENAEYQVEATINGEVYQGQTSIVNDFIVNQSTSNPNVKLSLYNQNTSSYIGDEIEWNSGLDGKRYLLYYRFNYREVIGTDTTAKSFTRLIGRRISPSITGGDNMSILLVGQDFFASIPNFIADDPLVTSRLFDNVDLLWEVANEDLHVYMQLNEPVTGIVEDRPPFTNITNDGLGIVVSRTTKSILNKELRNESLLELVTGQYSGNLKFCVPTSADPTIGCL